METRLLGNKWKMLSYKRMRNNWLRPEFRLGPIITWRIQNQCPLSQCRSWNQTEKYFSKTTRCLQVRNKLKYKACKASAIRSNIKIKLNNTHRRETCCWWDRMIGKNPINIRCCWISPETNTKYKPSRKLSKI